MLSRWINNQKRRYYTTYVARDLLGDWSIVRAWGSMDSQHGKLRITATDDYDEAAALLAEIERRRRLRGYTRIGHRAT